MSKNKTARELQNDFCKRCTGVIETYRHSEMGQRRYKYLSKEYGKAGNDYYNVTTFNIIFSKKSNEYDRRKCTKQRFTGCWKEVFSKWGINY